ncbi:VOC family protein [Spirosoma taeanense]|uniref:VOC family protein n=1 Tax=Spirosoma taeanense TaxID=2735870 RepID=A0A6M5YC92_9BACT|nr:VOC family protein [Spirosoma taeanense]QJW90910.1 VOC family protein [Spirosoma taeanense]
MATMIFVNLPVKDLNRSVEFFTQLGFSFDARFTNEDATCMVVSENSIYVMLLVEKFFKTFTSKEIADATKTTESIICLSADSREKVDELADKALASGGSFSYDPIDQGFMYGRSFQDPDGHLWEVMYMDPSAVNPEQVSQDASSAA